MGLPEESGFTLIELMFAVVVTSVGIFALVATLDTSRELITASEKREAAVHHGQRELERILEMDYDEAALSGYTPSISSDPREPSYFVTDAGATLDYYRWDQDRVASDPASGPVERCSTSGEPATHCEPMVATGGAISPDLETIPVTGPDGRTRVRLQVQRFVTWVDDPCCDGTEDYKRVSVAVRVLGRDDTDSRLAGAQQRPMVFTTIVSPPGSDA